MSRGLSSISPDQRGGGGNRMVSFCLHIVTLLDSKEIIGENCVTVTDNYVSWQLFQYQFAWGHEGFPKISDIPKED